MTAGADVDPVTLEVIRSALPAISDEMAHTLYRTSYNMMINEVRDYCTALLSPGGELFAQNVGGVSHFVADLGAVIRDGVRRHGLEQMAAGDVVVTNHQRAAGQHLNNVVVYAPVLHDGDVIAFAVVRAHWVDVGGLSTGFGGVGAFDPWSEGLQLDQIKVHEAGVPDTKALKLIADNIRYPQAALGDLRAQIAACELGGRRFVELVERYGRDTVTAAIAAIAAAAERRCRARVAEIPDGVYRAESALDPPTPDEPPVRIAVTVAISGGDMTIDLSDCAPQSPTSPMNSRTLAGAYIAYKALTEPLEPVNEGSFAALRVVVPEGNLMMARFPALMSDWSTPLPTVVDCVWRALAEALPGQVPAGHSGRLGPELIFYGDVDGEPFIVQGLEGGGWGGRPWADGESVSVSVCQGDVRNAPIEKIELQNPVVVEERALRRDSGGPGRHRGGLGGRVVVRGLVEGRWYLDSGNRTLNPPWGLWGGAPGEPSVTLVQRPDDDEPWPVERARMELMPAGTVVTIQSAGGGGWGDPLERDPECVAGDVREGAVSAPVARERYGVVLAADGRGVDAAATAELRERLRAGAAQPATSPPPAEIAGESSA